MHTRGFAHFLMYGYEISQSDNYFQQLNSVKQVQL